jgi:hypothetical protein
MSAFSRYLPIRSRLRSDAHFKRCIGAARTAASSHAHLELRNVIHIDAREFVNFALVKIF